MNWFESHSASIRLSINRWYESNQREELKGTPLQLHRNQQSLPSKFSSHLIQFTRDDIFSRFNAEQRLLNKLYLQAKDQNRSFLYMGTLRKLRQVTLKAHRLKLTETITTIATSFCSQNHFLTESSFASLVWRLLAFNELTYEIQKFAQYTAALATEEMSSKLFLHYPIAFISIAASLFDISSQIRPIILHEVQVLLTLKASNVIPFGEPGIGFIDLPWDESLRVELDMFSKQELITISPIAPKIDVQITSKPSFKVRTPIQPQNKRKSRLDSIGF